MGVERGAQGRQREGKEGRREGRLEELFKDMVACIRNMKKTGICILMEEKFLQTPNDGDYIPKFKPNQVKS